MTPVLRRTNARRLLAELGDSRSVPFGIVSTVAVAGLSLIDPNRLRPAGRLAHRLAIAGLTGAMTWAASRPTPAEVPNPGLRAGVTVGATGLVLAASEASEALDARMQRGLERAGVRRPRVALAALSGVLSAATWWLDRRTHDGLEPGEREFEGTGLAVSSTVDAELGAELRALVSALLARGERFGGAELREQLAGARIEQWRLDGDDGFVADASFEVDETAPRAVPGNGRFPVIGRFRGLDERTFDLALWIHEGRLDSMSISPADDWSDEDVLAWDEGDRDVGELGAWPAVADLEVLVESRDGWARA